MNKKLMGLLAGLVFGLSASAVQAIPITFDFEGVVTEYRTDLATDPFGGTIGIGDVVTGYYTFDSDGTDSEPGTGIAYYSWNPSPYVFHSEVNGHSFDIDESLYVNVMNDCGQWTVDPITGCGTVDPLDLFGIHAYENVSLGINKYNHQYLVDDTLAWLNNDSLIVTPPSLSDLTRADGAIGMSDSSGWYTIHNYFILYDLTSLTLGTTPVPEPSSLLLMGIGLAGLGFVRLRKRT